SRSTASPSRSCCSRRRRNSGSRDRLARSGRFRPRAARAPVRALRGEHSCREPSREELLAFVVPPPAVLLLHDLALLAGRGGVIAVVLLAQDLELFAGGG